MKTPRQSLGRWGEALAADYLLKLGYSIIDRNARTPYGEIDLVARWMEGGMVGISEARPVTVFVEVKTRSSHTYGLPEEAVTARKQAHLLAAAQAYLQQHPELVGDWRIDVIAIQRYHPAQAPTIRHFENAIH